MADKMADAKPAVSEISEREFVTILISLYRDSPELWESNYKYKDKAKRNEAKQRIVNELREYRPYYTEDDFRRKINILRTNYNREFSKLQSALSHGNIVVPKLWYYNELSFLGDQMKMTAPHHIFLEPDNCDTEFSATPQKPRKIKRLASKVASNNADEVEIIVRNWAIKFNRLAPDQRIYADKIINDILFEGEMGALTRHGVKLASHSSKNSSFSSVLSSRTSHADEAEMCLSDENDN